MIALSFVLVGLFLTVATPFPTIPDNQNYTLPEPGTCGISLADRIKGGKKTALNAYPWTALLGVTVLREPHITQFICGGSLISDRYVLTAAHCFKDINHVTKDLFVRLGEWDVKSEIDCYENNCADKPIDFYITTYLLHESYDPKTLHNDIALMKLPSPVIFTEFISPVCLPLSKAMKNQPKVGRIVTAIGWGCTGNAAEETLGQINRYKKEVNFPVLDSKACISGNILPSSQFCTANNTEGQTCKGDSGGPVVAAENDGYWYQYGIVSYSKLHGDTILYKGLVRVCSFLPWIKKTMAQLADAGTFGPTNGK